MARQGSVLIYLLLSIVFISLSVLGILYLLRPFSVLKNTSFVSPTPTSFPPTSFPSLTPPSPTIEISITAAPTENTLPSTGQTSTVSSDLVPTPTHLTYDSPTDNFSVTYRSNRRVYADKENTGNRYTFYRSDSSNIAVHIGPSWAWIHPGRSFSGQFLLDGRNTFRYDIADQTIVDVDLGGRYLTIQCVHQGTSDNKTECDQFLQSFKFR